MFQNNVSFFPKHLKGFVSSHYEIKLLLRTFHNTKSPVLPTAFPLSLPQSRPQDIKCPQSDRTRVTLVEKETTVTDLLRC